MRKIILSITATCFLFACNQPKPKKQPESIPKAETTRKTVQNPQQNALTLPVLDAMFYYPDFSKSLKDSIGLSPAQIGKLRKMAHESLRELSENGVDTASARNATKSYQTSIRDIIGEDKLAQLTSFVNTRYSKGVEGLAPTEPNFLPKDTRIVVNAPAFRLDVFKNGQLLKTYKIGIGYPEFHLPTGMRRADTIIFNPSWTPPDEPWVKGHFSPGVKVSAANELNPLGIIKIPIGKPSLIHGGKSSDQIGGFASHGCVGLTNALVQDLTGYIVMLGNSELTKDDIKGFAKHLGKTNAIRLPNPVPIDLRYETIVAGDGMLHIYRDVYERGTNTLQNAKNILQVYHIGYDQLSEQERSNLAIAIDEMNRDPRGNAIAGDTPSSQNGVAATKQDRSKKGQVTRKIKGKKQADVPIAALDGKGYPAPVDPNLSR